MRVETIEIYQFDELTKEAKEKAIESVRESYYQHNDFAEWAIDQCYLFQPEDMMDKEEIIKNTRGKIYFSTDRDWFIDCADSMEIVDEKAFLNWLGLPESIHNEVEYFISTPNHRNSDTCIEVLPIDNQLDIYDFEEKHGISFQDIEDKFKEEIVLKALKRIKDDIDYRFTDECIIEDIEANEIEFYKDGSKY